MGRGQTMRGWTRDRVEVGKSGEVSLLGLCVYFYRFSILTVVLYYYYPVNGAERGFAQVSSCIAIWIIVSSRTHTDVITASSQLVTAGSSGFRSGPCTSPRCMPRKPQVSQNERS